MQLVGRYRQASTDPALLLTIQRLVPDRGVPLADLCRQVDQSNPTGARIHIFHLLANGDLSFDPRQEPISDQTHIYPGGVITMGRIRLGVGTEWLLDGRAWRVVRQFAPDRFVVQDTKDLRASAANDTCVRGTWNCGTSTT